ncbi:MAG: hypothetical protein J0I34_12895 [Pseudonocardia sp.]|uniref:hypothetical protein n=1 Tax=unclassified Pseudonocardia TaxID=2619320 RepID=UPI001AC53235|nr:MULTISPECIES: hypothetical protein [unclassified Pseudonocardia]MBN9109672.1 hypothetical protein [Pseudonocardia sp.]
MPERDPMVADDLDVPGGAGLPGLPVVLGADTDEDGGVDTLAVVDDLDLLLHMDLDGDGLSDEVLVVDMPGVEPRGRWWSWLWPW